MADHVQVEPGESATHLDSAASDHAAVQVAVVDFTSLVVALVMIENKSGVVRSIGPDTAF